MRNKLQILFVLMGIVFLSFSLQKSEPWTKEQLMKPEELAAILRKPLSVKPFIYNIGPSGEIIGSINIGPTKDKENLQKLRESLDKLPRNAEVVIYCGCCPFNHCPNIRPAFSLLKEMGFTKPWLLELNSNLKVDWINKGFPMKEQ